MTPPKKYPKSTRKKDALRVVARQYGGANLHRPKSYYDDVLTMDWGNQENYEVTKQVGKGKYGEVYEAIDLRTGASCVVKIMRPVKEHRLRREIKILRHVQGGPNIVSLLEVVRDPETKTPCFVFERVDALSFKELQASVSADDIRHYAALLLQALDFCHSRGIMHRDVKPGNVLFDHSLRTLRLIDWGLADFYHPGKEYPVRVATRFYKGPELLVDIRDYDYSLDVWGVGCMLAALLFKKPVFFRGEDEFDQLFKVTRVLGTDELYKYCDKYGVELDPRLAQMCGYKQRVPWRKLVTPENQHLVSPAAFDLLDKLLRYDHHERLTCEEALAHEYFAPLGLPRRGGGRSARTASAAAATSAAAAGGDDGDTGTATSSAAGLTHSDAQGSRHVRAGSAAAGDAASAGTHAAGDAAVAAHVLGDPMQVDAPLAEALAVLTDDEEEEVLLEQQARIDCVGKTSRKDGTVGVCGRKGRASTGADGGGGMAAAVAAAAAAARAKRSATSAHAALAGASGSGVVGSGRRNAAAAGDDDDDDDDDALPGPSGRTNMEASPHTGRAVGQTSGRGRRQGLQPDGGKGSGDDGGRRAKAAGLDSHMLAEICMAGATSSGGATSSEATVGAVLGGTSTVHGVNGGTSTAGGVELVSGTAGGMAQAHTRSGRSRGSERGGGGVRSASAKVKGGSKVVTRAAAQRLQQQQQHEQQQQQQLQAEAMVLA